MDAKIAQNTTAQKPPGAGSTSKGKESGRLAHDVSEGKRDNQEASIPRITLKLSSGKGSNLASSSSIADKPGLRYRKILPSTGSKAVAECATSGYIGARSAVSRGTGQKIVTSNVSDIKNQDRQRYTSNIVTLLTNKIKEDVKSGAFSLPIGSSADGLGLRLGLDLEFAIHLWGPGKTASPQYEAKVQKILEDLSTDPQLRYRVLTGAVTPKQLCSFPDKVNTTVVPDKRNSNPAQIDQGQDEIKNAQSSQHAQEIRNKIVKLRLKRRHQDDPPASVLKTIEQDPTSVENSQVREDKKSKVSKRNRDENSANDNADALEIRRGVPTGRTRDHGRRIEELKKITADYIYPDPADVAVTYLDTNLYLPADAPLGWPHLIDLSTLDESDTTGLCIADMVVTVLLNHSPATLARFMDMSHNFVFHVKERHTSDDQDLLIVRTEMAVTVGFVDEGEKWSVRHRYALRATPLAMWTPLFIEDYQGGFSGSIVIDDVVRIMVAGEAMAFETLKAQAWKPSYGASIHVRNSSAWRS